MVTVVCWKWGGIHPRKGMAFGSDHVNRLASMIERNTTIPNRLVCVTDDGKGIRGDVTVVRMDNHFQQFSELGGCYRRLRSFDMAAGLACFGPRFISVDLDVVITGNIDNILDFQEDFRIWGDRYRRRTPYCGSLWGMRAGSREKVWTSFKDSPSQAIQTAKAKGYVGTDQAHISTVLFPNEATWGTDDGVFNFNTQIRRTPRMVYKDARGEILTIDKRKGDLPPGCRIVFFNGKYDPSQDQLQKSYPWIREMWK